MIKADPIATAEEIATLDAEDAIQHPNCPLGLWWELAAHRPFAALHSPAGSLLLLEDPARWAALEKKQINTWVREGVNQLDVTRRLLLTTDCAGHVLPISLQRHPGIHVVREAIRVRRRFAQGLADGQEWAYAKAQALAYPTAMPEGGVKDGAEAALYAAADSGSRSVLDHAAESAGQAAEYAARNVKPFSNIYWHKAYFVERKWQWMRLQQYLRREI